MKMDKHRWIPEITEHVNAWISFKLLYCSYVIMQVARYLAMWQSVSQNDPYMALEVEEKNTETSWKENTQQENTHQREGQQSCD